MPQRHDLLVLDIKRRTLQDLRALAKHCARTAGNLDHIDHSRTHLNEAVVGEIGKPEEAAAAYIKATRARVDRRNVKPYTSLVLSASAGYFRPQDPSAGGTWDDKRYKDWKDASVRWLRQTFGDDLVFVETHLDETTPHLHALVVPTYQKVRKGKAGRRAVSHHKHPAFSGRNSYHRLLDGYAEACQGLGLRRGRPADKRTPQTKADHARELLDEAKETSATANADRLDALLLLTEAERDRASAGRVVGDARGRLTAAEARERAFLIGTEAIGSKKLRFLPGTGDKPDSLTKGECFPEDRTEGRHLVAAIRPAWDFVVKAAKIVHDEHDRIRQAWAALKAQGEQVERERTMLRESAANLSARAKIVGEAEMAKAEARQREREREIGAPVRAG